MLLLTRCSSTAAPHRCSTPAVADFATLVGTYSRGFAIITEPYDDRLPSASVLVKGAAANMSKRMPLWASNPRPL